MRIVVMGPQGSGKGTQGELLSNALQVPLLGMGDIFRRAAAEAGELGERLADYLKRGELVPDIYVIEAIVRAVHSEEARNGFVLDGYPRRLGQVDELDQILGDETLDLVVLLNLPREEAMRRALSRCVCRNVECGAVYGSGDALANGAPCPRCGSPVGTRDDDTEETLDARYDLYESETVPAIELYRQRGLLVEVSAVGTKESIYKRITAALSKHLAGHP